MSFALSHDNDYVAENTNNDNNDDPSFVIIIFHSFNYC